MKLLMLLISFVIAHWFVCWVFLGIASGGRYVEWWRIPLIPFDPLIYWTSYNQPFSAFVSFNAMALVVSVPVTLSGYFVHIIVSWFWKFFQ